MEASKTLSCDWSRLPPEVLNLIAKKLYELSDFVRFRAVCRAWRFSAPITDQPPQFPWVLKRGTEINGDYWDEPNLRFYSIPSDKVHTIYAPNIILHKWLTGRALEEHFLWVWHNSGTFSLINPLNNQVILLPTLTPFSTCYQLYWVGQQQQNHKGADGDSSVICCGFRAKNSSACKFAFLHVGGQGQGSWWEPIKLMEDQSTNCRHCTFFYLMGMLFTVERFTGLTKVIHIAAAAAAGSSTSSSSSSSYIVPPAEPSVRYSSTGNTWAWGTIHLVEVSGHIFRLHNYCDDSFDIHRMDAIESGSPRWVNVKHIGGNHALFIDNYGCFALGANPFCGIKENCIYLFYEIFTGSGDGYSVVLERIDMETGARERLPCPFTKPVCWFAPNLQYHM